MILEKSQEKKNGGRKIRSITGGKTNLHSLSLLSRGGE